ncbi:MAG TPA: acyl-CoA dehydrogenase family protein [Candidatus Binataceae bacterium]|nr:acyl-CoA dehydrogenase family protein [Candidatus Binataceae bacterium]
MQIDNGDCSTIGRVYGEAKYIAPLLPAIAAQAAQADQSRTIAPDVIAAIKQTDIMRMSASREIAGIEESVVAIANELRAIAPLCGSTAWCLWNHLCVFHLYAAALGPENADFLSSIISKRQWVCFGAGASTEVVGVDSGDQTFLTGVAAFASGCRYAEWGGVAFARQGLRGGLFSVVDLHHPKLRIDPTWNGSAVRASATDNVYYDGVEVPHKRVVRWPPKHRAMLRDPNHQVIHHRYREDWVALSVVWLAAMATGIAQASIDDAARGIRDRIAIFGTKMVDRPTIHINLGRAQMLANAATDTVYAAMAETDARIRSCVTPTEGDYFRQTSAGTQAIQLCDEAMKLVLRVLGGNGLREGTDFERRFRDFQAIPVHINGHVDRLTEQVGRVALGLESTNPF